MQAVKRVFQILFSAALLSVVLGCAGNAHKESTGEYVDDSWITSKVKAAFVNDKTLSAAEINVETFKGTVQLSGFVKDPGDVSHAGNVAREIKGVKSVKNDLHVK
jgi:osmotically-inducible protein OsmY